MGVEIPSDLGETIPVYLKQLPPSPQELSQARMANIMPHSSHSPTPMPGSPERDSSPTPFQLQVNSITLPDDVLHLQEKMNDAMVHLFTVRASIDTHWWRIMSETEVTHCQNEIKTSEAIREVKASYVATLGDTEATNTTAMRKTETTHSTSTSEVEAAHITTVRKAEAASAVQASKLQQTHQETTQNLEDEALEVEKCACQSFLQACGAALQACPNEALGKLMYPIHLLTGNMSLTGPLMATSPLIIKLWDPIPSPCHPRRSATATHSLRAKWQHLPGHEVEPGHPRDREPTSCPRELPQQRQREEDPLAEHLGAPIRRPSTRIQTWLSA